MRETYRVHVSCPNLLSGKSRVQTWADSPQRPLTPLHLSCLLKTFGLRHSQEGLYQMGNFPLKCGNSVLLALDFLIKKT